MRGEDICQRDKCTGCMACANICPKSCIEMKSGKLGHLYPFVDQNKCVDCGLCHKICPESQLSTRLKYPLTAFAALHKEREEYLSSTSGGAAAAFSQYIISQGGVVYGCRSDKGIMISHVRVTRLEDLKSLKGSKYVQSYIGDTYKHIKRDLTDNLTVLFIGTPCQCSGLKSFLRKDYPNLYCVDLICHGVPSRALLKSHIDHISKGIGVSVAFRKGNDMGLRVFDDHGKMIYYSNIWNERYKDAYYNTFIDGYTYRDSCYQCRYACPERVSDVTIGDFWGLGKDLRHDTVNGISCILPISEKGFRLVKASSLELHEREVSEAVKGNGQLQHPKKLTGRIKRFQKMQKMLGVSCAYRLCELDHILDLRLWQPIKRRLKI